MPRTPAPIDDIKRGQYVALYGDKDGDDRPDPFTFGYRRKTQCNGMPLLVVAVDPPFVVMTEPDGTVVSVDTRHAELKVLSRKYVNHILEDLYVVDGRGRSTPVGPKPKKRKRQSDPDEDRPRCIRCAAPLRKRRLRMQGKKRAWLLVCDACGWEGYPAPCE